MAVIENSGAHANTTDAEEKTVELRGYLKEFRNALNEEIAAVKKSGQTSTLLYGGHKIPSKGQENWYQFRIQYMPNLPADTPCKLKVGSNSYYVTVIAVDNDSIILSSAEALPDTMAKAQLENGATVLMEQLIKRIEKNSTITNLAGKRMLESAGLPAEQTYHKINDILPVFAPSDVLNDKQKNAIISAVTNDITYIWGPPGTGKTSVISRLIIELFNQNRSVLLLSHTNTAVDGAIKKVDKEYHEIYHTSQKTDCPILRYGNADVDEHLLMPHHVGVKGKDLYAQEEQLIEERKQVQEELTRVQHCIAEYKWNVSSDIDGLAKLASQINEAAVSTSVLEQDLACAKVTLDKAKHEYPNAVHIARQEKVLETAKKRLDELQTDHTSITRQRETYATEMTIAHDNVVKHRMLEKLQVEMLTHMSIDGQEQRLRDEQASLILLKQSIDRLRTEQKRVLCQMLG